MNTVAPGRSAAKLAAAIGLNQLIAWGTTFYLPAVIAAPAAASLHVPETATIGAFSWSLLLAGVCAPRVGRQIDRVGGRGILVAGDAVMATGLLVLATAHGLVQWYAGWTLLGIGMSLGLYDAAFAAVGRLLGEAAAPVITGITLLGGLASTAGWSTAAVAVGHVGWRATLAIFAATQVAVNIPLVLAALPPLSDQPFPPREPATPGAKGEMAGGGSPGGQAPRARTGAVVLLGAFFTIRWLIASAIAVFVLPLFTGLGVTHTRAVVLAGMIGPSQVAGRLLDWGLTGHIGSITRARLGALLCPLGVAAVLLAGPAALPVFAVLYGMSNGIMTINRGTLPMALFGPRGYATLLGWLAVPVLLAQAGAPILAAPLMAWATPRAVTLIVGAAAALALALLLPLRPRHGRSD